MLNKKEIKPDITDIDIIKESILKVASDKELFKKVLINTGLYDKDLKLISKQPNKPT